MLCLPESQAFWNSTSQERMWTFLLPKNWVYIVLPKNWVYIILPKNWVYIILPKNWVYIIFPKNWVYIILPKNQVYVTVLQMVCHFCQYMIPRCRPPFLMVLHLMFVVFPTHMYSHAPSNMPMMSTTWGWSWLRLF